LKWLIFISFRSIPAVPTSEEIRKACPFVCPYEIAVQVAKSAVTVRSSGLGMFGGASSEVSLTLLRRQKYP